jgi:hypothetical protein
VWEIAKEILTLLIIPIVVWGISVEVRTAVAAEKIHQVSGDMGKIDTLTYDVRQNSLKLARLEGKLDTANARLEEIRRMLSAPTGP